MDQLSLYAVGLVSEPLKSSGGSGTPLILGQLNWPHTPAEPRQTTLSQDQRGKAVIGFESIPVSLRNFDPRTDLRIGSF